MAVYQCWTTSFSWTCISTPQFESGRSEDSSNQNILTTLGAGKHLKSIEIQESIARGSVFLHCIFELNGYKTTNVYRVSLHVDTKIPSMAHDFSDQCAVKDPRAAWGYFGSWKRPGDTVTLFVYTCPCSSYSRSSTGSSIGSSSSNNSSSGSSSSSRRRSSSSSSCCCCCSSSICFCCCCCCCGIYIVQHFATWFGWMSLGGEWQSILASATLRSLSIEVKSLPLVGQCFIEFQTNLNQKSFI